MTERNQEQLMPVTPAALVRAPAALPAPLGPPHLTLGADAAAQLRWAQKMESLGRLSARVAHEVNNQATLMLLRTAAVLERGESAGASRAEVQELHRAAERVARLMRQWLTLGRRGAQAPRRLDLNALVSDMARTIEVALDEGISLVTDLRAGPAWVVADYGGLEHVVLNLVLNARDAMAGSGTLTLRTANVDLRGPAGDYLLPFVPGPHVMLSVRDSGCGMDRATQAHIFEPYFTTKGPERGSGLGLHNVWETVRESGGTLQVSSAPGQGAVFAVYLPLAREAPEVVARPGRPAPRPAKETVLVVEDEDSVRTLLREVLSRQGYAVLEARDGRAALALATGYAGPIHLLVTDCVLPHVAGRELARRLKARSPGLKVLYMSGYPPTEDELPANPAAGTAFLEKPFTPAALTTMARELLSARQ
jgi:signal transduction histidine kinase/CheY-like chemotaxis protein